jgi:hypothetical protein
VFAARRRAAWGSLGRGVPLHEIVVPLHAGIAAAAQAPGFGIGHDDGETDEQGEQGKEEVFHVAMSSKI